MTQIMGYKPRDPETYAVIGAAIEVHRILGPGFLERVYRAALGVEFQRLRVPCSREVTLPVIYRSVVLPVRYRVDFICYGSVLVELKAVTRLSSIEECQLLNYLKASRLSRGLLLNFGGRSLECRRFVGPCNQPAQSV
ncbi:MAG: GxxExxY protein [Gemmatimonadales bacterium]